MARTRYVVAYDIRDPVRLRAVHSRMKGFGQPLQYSVFLCDLTEIEKIAMRMALRDVMRLNRDSVVIIDVGDATSRGRYCFEFMGVHSELPTQGGPQIV